MGPKKRSIRDVDRRLAMASASLVIIRRLNMKHPPEEVRRVIELLENLRGAKVRHQLLSGNWMELLKDTELPRLAHVINQQLLRYEWTPVITDLKALTVVTAWRTQARELAAAGPHYGNPLTPMWAAVHSDDVINATEWEQQAVWYLLTRGHWERYRRCQQCSRWFYANTDSQKFCETKCRQSWASQAEEFKDKRKLYMRKKRAEEKAKDERARAMARRRK